MKKVFFTFFVLLASVFSHAGFAQSSTEWLPESGVKSPYSPLAMPTVLKPVQDSMATLLNTGYQITTSTPYAGKDVLFTLKNRTQTVLCILNAPNPQTDQNIPTSRCWALN